jgi:hypothetical protein
MRKQNLISYKTYENHQKFIVFAIHHDHAL